MNMTDSFAGIKFAFDLPEDHPLYGLETDDIWDALDQAKVYLPNDTELNEIDMSGAKITLVFRTYNRTNISNRINFVQSWLESFEVEFEAEEVKG